MKKFYYLSMVCFILSVVSCSDDETVYSCDKNVNMWVLENIEKIQTMKMEEWKALPSSKKRAAYGALKKEQRINFWNRKFDNVLTLNWSLEEQKHILKARNFVMEHQDYFSGKDLTDEQQNIVDLFCYEWSEIAQNKYGWSKDTIIAIIASLDDMNEDKRLTRSGIIDDPFDQNYTDSNCNCNKKYDFCGMTSVCVDERCTATPYCGWFLLSQCNGRCEI